MKNQRDNDLLSTLSELLPGISKLIAVVGIVVVGITTFSKITGVAEVNFTPDADLIRDFNVTVGKNDSRFAVLEFIDFQCPGCKASEPIVKQIIEENKSEVRFVYKMFPLENIHANAKTAAYSALAAHRQGKFFEYKEKLFAYQESPGLSNDTQEKIALEIGLDVSRWKTDRRSREIEEQVAIDQMDGKTAIPVSEGSSEKSILPGTPSFVFVRDGKILYQNGSMQKDEFQAKINDLKSK
jgi:protein-disulfide isomerase